MPFPSTKSKHVEVDGPFEVDNRKEPNDDKHWLRVLNDKLATPEGFDQLFHALRKRSALLMLDNVGHYYVEALFNYSTDVEFEILLRYIAPSIELIACHKTGSYSLQTIMDLIQNEDHVGMLGSILATTVHRIMTHPIGHHVVVKFVSTFGFGQSHFVHHAIQKHTWTICRSQYSQRIVKAIIDQDESKKLTGMYKAIANMTLKLVEDPYGNYIIQHLLSVGPPVILNLVKGKLLGNYFHLARHKISSNVVEKCLLTSGEHWRAIITRELLSNNGALALDKFGNYVLQTAVKVADKDSLYEIEESVTPSLQKLRENVRTKWTNLLIEAKQKFAQDESSDSSSPKAKRCSLVEYYGRARPISVATLQ
eukprot:17413_1